MRPGMSIAAAAIALALAFGLLPLVLVGGSGLFLGAFATSTQLQVLYLAAGVALLAAAYLGAPFYPVAIVESGLFGLLAVVGVLIDGPVGSFPLGQWDIALNFLIAAFLWYAWVMRPARGEVQQA